MTTETDLALDSLRRDLERFAVTDDLRARKRIKERMIDTVESMGHQVIRDDIVETAIRMIKADKIIDGLIKGEES